MKAVLKGALDILLIVVGAICLLAMCVAGFWVVGILLKVATMPGIGG